MLAALNPIALQLGGLQVHWYGVIIASGAVLAVWLAMREARRVGVDEDHILTLVLWALPLSLVGARLYYVIFQWPYYAAHPSEIIAIWHGGIAIYGGLLAGAAVFLIYAYRNLLSVWTLLDIAAPSVLIAQAIGRWGNFMNQEAFGAKTSLGFLQSLHLPEFAIEQMKIDGFYRQPTFLYESLWSLIGFVLLMSLRHKTHLFKQGEVLLAYVMWYAFGRFFVEGMRTDSLYMFAGLRVSQVLSVVLFFGALALLWYRRRQNLPWYNPIDNKQKTGVK